MLRSHFSATQVHRFGRFVCSFSFLIVSMLACYLPNLYCAEVALAWDPNTEPYLAGYKIHYGNASRSYTITIDVGNTLEYVVTGLTPGETYYFAATAYDSYENQSDYSDEVEYTVPLVLPDTDGDGISDTDETNVYHTDPTKADTDGDGIEDGDELIYWGDNWNGDADGDGIINLLDYDSDSDGQADGAEITGGLDPSDPSDSRTTVYEDGEHGNTVRWSIYDNDPVGASISNVYDAERGSRVIELSGFARANGYRLRKADGSNWGNSSQFFIEWSMNFSEGYIVYIDVETSAGHRYMSYNSTNYDSLGDGEYVYHGLGVASRSGEWRTFARDLQSDLQEAQPGVSILSVNGFLIRGSGRIDNVKLHDHMPHLSTVYEDAEHGTTRGWSIYDNDPTGGSIINVYDAERGNHVIQINGVSTANGFKLRSPDGSKWGDSNNFIIQWSMNFSSAFLIYIDIETSSGHRYLTYRAVDNDALGVDEYVYHGLGTESKTAGWRTFIRDLQADLNEAQPGVEIHRINGFLVRGSGKIDDIKLMNYMP